MSAKDWFETIRLNVLDLARAEERCAELADACAPHSMASEPSGRGGVARRLLTPEDRLIDAEQARDAMRQALQPDLDRACDVLYGASGRGGIARERSSAAADSIYGYYLQGMKWRQVADELVHPESRDGPQWCRRVAQRALAYADEVGMGVLADT